MNVELITVTEEHKHVLLAGFTMTRQIGGTAREAAEFFVARRYRRHGVGRDAAHQMFHSECQN